MEKNLDFYKSELAKLIKANKTRRLYVANKNGYKTVKGYRGMLERMIAKLSPSSAETEVEHSSDVVETSALDMVIAFDTTGSMSSYIASVRTHVQELIKQLFANSPNLRLKIVAFGDYCDMVGKDNFGKAYQETEITNNQEALINFVRGAQNTGGGDIDEFYELVIKKIVSETPWREDAKKSVLLIADSAPHPVGYSYKRVISNNQIDWREEAKIAASLGIQFDTLRIHEYQRWYKELSDITGGVCLNFSNARKTSNVVEGLTYARTNRAAYKTTLDAAEASGDTELFGAIKQMGTLL